MPASRHYHSKIVTTNQKGIHGSLPEMVSRHQDSVWQKPYQAHNLAAFDELKKQLSSAARQPRILDSCCGTGMSTITLARQHPDHWVTGIDQSAHRLAKNTHAPAALPDNLIFLRGNCEDLWRLCIEENIRFEKHFLLYPNPWPKSAHLKRRWHGHPVFPVMPELAPVTELRSNWKLYLDEFALAWQQLTGKTGTVRALPHGEPLTLFEKKYGESGHTLWVTELGTTVCKT